MLVYLFILFFFLLIIKPRQRLPGTHWRNALKQTLHASLRCTKQAQTLGHDSTRTMCCVAREPRWRFGFGGWVLFNVGVNCDSKRRQNKQSISDETVSICFAILTGYSCGLSNELECRRVRVAESFEKGFQQIWNRFAEAIATPKKAMKCPARSNIVNIIKTQLNPLIGFNFNLFVDQSYKLLLEIPAAVENAPVRLLLIELLIAVHQTSSVTSPSLTSIDILNQRPNRDGHD